MSSLIEYTDQLIEKLEAVLRGFADRPELTPVLARWQDQLAQMRAYAHDNQSVSIAFVGGTGAGKSTLINALLGADLLPTHSFRTCTSAAIAVAHASRKTCQASIEFLPLSAWEDEKARFLEEIRESGESGHAAFVHQDFLYKAWALYRPRKGQPPMPFPLEQLLELLREPLPETLRKQLEAGELVLKAKTPGELKQELARFLTAESPVWPLIRRVRITGPFPALADGLELIDLPGLNDPNPVREQIARDYLRQAEFIWLIFGTGRGLTREVVDLMKDQAFLNQIVLDGKVSALAFIGTRADDFVPELERVALGLPSNAPLEKLRTGRELMIRQQIQQQLSELTLWFGNRYKLSPQSGQILSLIASTLQSSPLHLTSALSWHALQGMLARSSARFDKPEQTGIPQLQAYMQEIIAEHGQKARRKLIRSQFQQMNQEIRRLVASLQHRQALKSAPAAPALEHQLISLQQDQTRALAEISTELGQNLRLKQSQFEQQVLFAFTDLAQRGEPLLGRWYELNWQHLQRAVRDGGRYSSPRSGVQVDMIKDLLGFLETEVALDWYDFFQQRLLKEIDTAQVLISELLAQTGQRAAELFADQPEHAARLNELNAQGQAILREQSFRSRRELEALIRDIQRQIGLLLEGSLRKSFKPIFAAAGALTGTGVKQQIMDALAEGLRKTLPELGSSFQPEMAEMLAMLAKGITHHEQELTRIVTEQLEMMAAKSP